jgi:hypothetical protein
MIPLDPRNVRLRSQPRKRDQQITRQGDKIPHAIDERGLVLLVFPIDDGHEQRRLHVDSAMQFEYRGQPLLDGIRQGQVVRTFEVFVIKESAGGFGWLIEEEGKDGLVVWCIGFR